MGGFVAALICRYLPLFVVVERLGGAQKGVQRSGRASLGRQRPVANVKWRGCCAAGAVGSGGAVVEGRHIAGRDPHDVGRIP